MGDGCFVRAAVGAVDFDQAGEAGVHRLIRAGEGRPSARSRVRFAQDAHLGRGGQHSEVVAASDIPLGGEREQGCCVVGSGGEPSEVTRRIGWEAKRGCAASSCSGGGAVRVAGRRPPRRCGLEASGALLRGWEGGWCVGLSDWSREIGEICCGNERRWKSLHTTRGAVSASWLFWWFEFRSVGASCGSKQRLREVLSRL